MFDIDIRFMKKYLVMLSFLVSLPAISHEVEDRVYFNPEFKQGDKMIYRLVESRFKQNMQGHYLELMYDTSFLVFKVREKNDSQILMDMNYAHAIINGEIYNDINPQLPNLLQTETYQLVLSKKGEFIELANWD